MIHPLFKILIQRPDLLMTHVGNYLDLLQQETRSTVSELLRAMVAWVAVVCLSLLGVVFTGVALMLGLLQQQFHWVLVAVPLCTLLLALLAWLFARKPLGRNKIAEIRQQVATDIETLRQAGGHDA